MTAAERALRTLLGTGDFRLTAAGGGGNSTIFRVDSDGRSFALKAYPQEAVDPRRRQETEMVAVRFLHACGIDYVPVFHGATNGYSLYDWLEGSPPVPPTACDIDDAAELTARLQSCSAAPGADAIAPAFEAGGGLHGLIEQVTERCRRLAASHDGDPELRNFCDGELAGALAAAAERARAAYAARGIEAYVLPPDERRLIHGDFGLHNMLRSPAGRLFLLDFEYFGWDDPVKMIADFALHPAAALTVEHRARYLAAATARLRSDRLRFRLGALLPLFAVRWACIVCNAFLPERRVRYAADAWRSTKERQLLQARSLLSLCAREGLL